MTIPRSGDYIYSRFLWFSINSVIIIDNKITFLFLLVAMLFWMEHFSWSKALHWHLERSTGPIGTVHVAQFSCNRFLVGYHLRTCFSCHVEIDRICLWRAFDPKSRLLVSHLSQIWRKPVRDSSATTSAYPVRDLSAQWNMALSIQYDRLYGCYTVGCSNSKNELVAVKQRVQYLHNSCRRRL